MCYLSAIGLSPRPETRLINEVNSAFNAAGKAKARSSSKLQRSTRLQRKVATRFINEVGERSLQRSQDTVNRSTRSARGPYRGPRTPPTDLRGRREVPTAVPGHRQQKLRQNLIVRLLKTHPLTTILENQQKRNVLVTRPCGGQADLLNFPEEFMTSDGQCREWTPETHLRNVIKMASFQAILAFVLALPYTNISS